MLNKYNCNKAVEGPCGWKVSFFPSCSMPPEVQDYSRVSLHLLVYHKLLGSENRFKSTSDPLECLESEMTYPSCIASEKENQDNNLSSKHMIFSF